MKIIYKTDIGGVDWAEMKAAVRADDFDNGRSAAQLAESFANSHSICLAYADDKLVGTARAISDGVCNAYVVDVWTHSGHRGHGVASAMMQHIIDACPGQHIYLFTDTAVAFYKKLGFREQPTGMQIISGTWLVAGPD